MIEYKEIEIQEKDQVLVFRVRDIPASILEKWFGKLLFLAGNKFELKENFTLLDLAESVLKVRFEDVEPLLDELLDYVERKIDGNSWNQVSLKTIDNYVKSPFTITKLRAEVIKHNIGFLPTEMLVKSSEQAEQIKSTIATSIIKMSTPTQGL